MPSDQTTRDKKLIPRHLIRSDKDPGSKKGSGVKTYDEAHGKLRQICARGSAPTG